MSSHLSASETIGLVQRLRETVQDLGAADEKLNQELRARTGAAQRRRQDGIAEKEALLASELSRLAVPFQAARDKAQRRHDQREARLAAGRESSLRRALEKIQNEEGRQKYIAQKGLLDTGKFREESLAANEAAYAEFSQSLGASQEAFAGLEAQAARAFRGFGRFVRLLASPGEGGAPEPASDERQLLERLHQLRTSLESDLKRFGRRPLPLLFRMVPLWLWGVLLVVCGVGLAPALRHFQLANLSPAQAAGGAGAGLALIVTAYFLGRQTAAPLAAAIARSLHTARRLHSACEEQARQNHARQAEHIEADCAARIRSFEQTWQRAQDEAVLAREVRPGQIEEKHRRAVARNDRQARSALEQIERDRVAATEKLHREIEAQTQHLGQAQDASLGKINEDYQARWRKLEEDWRTRMTPLYEAAKAAGAAAAAAFPPWQPGLWDNWAPPAAAVNAVPVGHLEVEAMSGAGGSRTLARLTLPGPARLSLPVCLTYPQAGSLLIETPRGGGDEAVAVINNVLFRLLATLPAGKASFTVIDPVKLGQNFAGIMHLADYEENIVNSRIWTQTTQIEQRLADLNEHMEKVIQMYLRNEYETIAEYNLQAGNIAEKYHFVVIADFPVNFSETAIRRLLHIAASGARCGVYTLIHWDHRYPPPPDFVPEALRKSSVGIVCDREGARLAGLSGPGIKLRLDAPPDADFATRFLHQVGEASRGANRVEVPFAQVIPAPQERWTLETTEELRVPIGRTGATKLQYLAIGKGTRQHALVAGKTGSGKSTLFHVVITNLALWCPPEEVEFYLVDFKKGVEFKCYASHRLPHARVVAIESDREFGLSVLQRVDEELRRRGDLFRKLGVQDIPGYKSAGGAEPMPRSLLIIDEFQEFFVEDDRISQAAAVLLDRIVRQGRAFGIHVVLGSQTLGGAYTLARATLGQMVIRIALQCNEADAYLIMDESNSAPRLLSRPGEGIYNDMAGNLEGNSPFQTVWLSDEERDASLEEVARVAGGRGAVYPGPVVFEGNAPADTRDNLPLRQALETLASKPPSAARFWLGAPNSIKGPTEALFQRRSGSNLLIVGQREEAVLAMFAVGLISLAAQHPRGAARFVFFDSTLPDTPQREFFERVFRGIPHELVVAKSGDIPEVMKRLEADLNGRIEDAQAPGPETFVFLHELQNYKKLRQDEDMAFSLGGDDAAGNPAQQLARLVTDGPSHGIHVIASVDTYNNVNRFLGRKALSEFEMRVLFQMSTNDSASLCDDPKASTLGLHRALFYNEQEGYLETFRPYALPPADWIDRAAAALSRLGNPPA